MKLLLAVAALLVLGAPMISALHTTSCPKAGTKAVVGAWNNLVVPSSEASMRARLAAMGKRAATAYLKTKGANAALGCKAADKPQLSGAATAKSGCYKAGTSAYGLEIFFTNLVKCSTGAKAIAKKFHTQSSISFKNVETMVYVELRV